MPKHRFGLQSRKCFFRNLQMLSLSKTGLSPLHIHPKDSQAVLKIKRRKSQKEPDQTVQNYSPNEKYISIHPTLGVKCELLKHK